MRRLVPAAVLALAACSAGDQAPVAAEGGERVACALGAGAAFADACAVDRGVQDGQRMLVVRHPDGAFRRFTVEPDGLALADGAETARVAQASASMLEVAVGEDRYRIPFAVKDHGAD